MDIPQIIITRVHAVLAVDNRSLTAHRDYSGVLAHNELILKTSGRTVIHFDGHTFDESEKTLRFLPKTGRNAQYTTETLVPGCCIDILFDTATPVPMAAWSEKCSRYDLIFPLFKKICAVWQQKKPGSTYICMGLLYEILGRLQQPPAYTPTWRTEKISPGVLYIDAHCNENIRVETAAAQCGITRPYFERLFRDVYGLTPKMYLTQRKIQAGRDLLQTGQYSVSEVAAMTGYANVQEFSRTFHKYTGFLPRSLTKPVPHTDL